jgi:hypothetical protein
VALGLHLIALALMAGSVLYGSEFARDSMVIGSFAFFTVGAIVVRPRRRWLALRLLIVALALLRFMEHLRS